MFIKKTFFGGIMKILGLITEYNPFHNGHLYHLNMSKKITGATHTIAIMSGNFVQRGEPAIIHKWERAKMAVKSGVDLVIELPALYACSTAEIFAYGAISLLDSLKTVNCVSFGSEAGDLNLLSKIADILVDPPSQFSIILKNYINSGFAFPIARSKAIIKYLEKIEHYKIDKLILINNTIKNPNNILGIEYLKAIKQLDSSIVPITMAENPPLTATKNPYGHCCKCNRYKNHILSNKPLSNIDHVIPNFTFDILLSNIDAGFAPISNKNFEKSILTILRRSNLDDIKNVFDVAEGLENKIFRCSIKVNTLPELYDCIKSKRYTLTRLQRILTHVLLNIDKTISFIVIKTAVPGMPVYWLLTQRAGGILRVLKNSSSIPIISNLKHYRPQNEAARKMLDIDIRATNIYSLAFKNKIPVKAPLDYTTSPYYENI